MQDIGLFSINNHNKGDFSLESVSTECDVRNLLVICSSDLTYKNIGKNDAEAMFTFPLEGNCVVFKFEATVKNKRIKGVCRELEEAKNLYEAAKEKGISTALIERHVDRHDTFNCKIGCIPANESATIHVELVMELRLCRELSDNSNSEVTNNNSRERFELALPLILRPRYSPPDYQSTNQMYVVHNTFLYSFKANVSGTRPIKNVTSINQTLQLEYTDKTGRTAVDVTMASKYDVKHDLDVCIEYEDTRQPFVYYEMGSEEAGKGDRKDVTKTDTEGAFLKPDVAMLNFLPHFNADEAGNSKFEIVIIIDRSGSMRGSNIEKAKECLLIFLKSLPVNCKFQIYGFGNNFDKVFDSPQLYTNDSMSTATEYQHNLEANMGGTNILSPITDMYSRDPGSDYSRLTFLLTDGDVGNQNAICSLIRKNTATTQVFAVGIGEGVSTSLIQKVAQSGNGKAVFVRSSNDLTEKVMEILELSLNTQLFTDGKVEFDCPSHVNIVCVPDKIPVLISNYFLTVFCMITGLKKNDTVKGRLTGCIDKVKKVNFELDISKDKGVQDSKYRAHRLLAKYKADELNRQIEDIKEVNGSFDKEKANLIELSIAANIVTDYTTFVVVDAETLNLTEAPISKYPGVESGARLFSSPMQRKCLGLRSQQGPPPPPPPACSGGGGAFSANLINFDMDVNSKAGFCAKIAAPAPPPAPPSAGMDSSPLFDSCDTNLLDMALTDESVEQLSNFSAPLKKAPIAQSSSNCDGNLINIGSSDESEPVERTDILMCIINVQNVDGSWNFESKLFGNMGLDLDAVYKNKPRDVSENLWATALVIQYFEIKLANQKKKWNLISKKAHAWVCSELTDKSTKDTLLKSAHNFINGL